MDTAQLADASEIYLHSFIWKDDFNSVPNEVKNNTRKRIAFALYNFHDAKANYFYLTKLREGGLNPNSPTISSNGLRVWWWVTSATIISLATLLDRNNKTNSVIALQRQLGRITKTYPELRVPSLPFIDLQDAYAEEVIKLRNNVFAHSNENFVENISEGTFILDDKMVNECLQNCFSLLKATCKYYFEGDIPETILHELDEAFALRLIGLDK